MINSTERLRLEAAYAASADPRSVRRCAAGLLIVLSIALAAVGTEAADENLVADISAPRVSTDH